jgi:hypothetical protein
MDFMTYIWDALGVSHVTIMVEDFPAEGVTLESLQPIIQEIREKSAGMVITADLKNVGILGLERFRSIARLVGEVLEYTKDDKLLKKIKIKNAGFIFRMVSRTLQIRDMLTFI